MAKSNSRMRKVSLTDLELLKLAAMESVFEGLANAEDEVSRHKWTKLALDLIQNSKVDWVTDMVSHLEISSPTINTDDANVKLSGFDLSKYFVDDNAKRRPRPEDEVKPSKAKVGPIFEPDLGDDA